MRYDKNHCYVGPEAWPQWFLRFNPWWRSFNYAAYLHDIFFRKGGGMPEFLRANRIFRTMCRASSVTRWQRFGAELHARAVEKYGYAFFTWRETCAKPYFR